MNTTPTKLLKTSLQTFAYAFLFGTIATIITTTIALHTATIPATFNPTLNKDNLLMTVAKDKIDYLFGGETIGLYKIGLKESFSINSKQLDNARDCMKYNSKISYNNYSDGQYDGKFDSTCYKLKEMSDSGSTLLDDELKQDLINEYRQAITDIRAKKRAEQLLASLKENDRQSSSIGTTGTYNTENNTIENTRYLNWGDFGQLYLNEGYFQVKVAAQIAVKHMPCTAYKDEFYPIEETTERTGCEKTFSAVMKFLEEETFYDYYGVKSLEELKAKTINRNYKPF